MNTSNQRSALRQTSPMILAALSIAASAGVTPVRADDVVQHKLGDHPAVLVQRMQKDATYDYASKFYPHPAWLYLRAEAPRELGHHPAVLIARRGAAAMAPTLAAFTHPAVSGERPRELGHHPAVLIARRGAAAIEQPAKLAMFTHPATGAMRSGRAATPVAQRSD